MRINIELDDDLIAEASRLTTIKSKQELVHLALKEFVKNHARKDILELIGEVQIEPVTAISGCGKNATIMNTSRTTTENG